MLGSGHCNAGWGVPKTPRHAIEGRKAGKIWEQKCVSAALRLVFSALGGRKSSIT